jgi:hypothetical protein
MFILFIETTFYLNPREKLITNDVSKTNETSQKSETYNNDYIQ